jgi:pilus assembly protein CpaC
MAVATKSDWFSREFKSLLVAAVVAGCSNLITAPSLVAQQRLTSQWSLSNSALSIEPNSNRQMLEMVVNTSREIIADQPFRRVRIQNPELIKAIPLEGGNRLQISALRTGVTQVDLLGADESVATVEVVVMGDVRELETILRRTFPQATLELTPISQGIIVNGFVSSSSDVETLTLISQQYFPTVINRVTVTGIHTVQLHTQIMEVSRTKLRTLGIDWQLIDGGDVIQSTVAEVVNSSTFNWTVVDNNTRFSMGIEALRRNNLVKVLASPTLTAVDGRPASFNVGGEIPILVPSGLGQVGVQYREFGTRLDYVAKVLGNGRIYLEVRPYVSEIDPSRSVTLQGISVPGLRSRFLETGVELNAGQTLALGGLLQVRTETINSGLPGLAEMPYIGVFFRKVREEQNEIELLITVTPDYAGAMDPHQVPYIVPGISTQSPNDKELYLKGYTEVPSEMAQPCLQPHGLYESVPGIQHSASSVSRDQSYPSQPRPPAMSVGPHVPLLVETPSSLPASGKSQTASGSQQANYR